MTLSPTWRVRRLDLWLDPVFDATLLAVPGLQLEVLPHLGDDVRTLAGLQAAHAYHVSAAKDELPRQWFVDTALLAQSPDLLCVSAGGAGYDTVDVAACTQAGIAVVNQAGSNAASVAEHTFALLLALVKRLPESGYKLRHERGFSREDLMGRELDGKTFGIVGLGQIGQRAARLAGAFGMQVIAYDPYLTPDRMAERGARAVDLDALLSQADVVSLHCPLNEETRGLMNQQAFARMQVGSLFISTARGHIHDETALLAALDSGHLAGAGLDVWAVEPPGNDAPLLQCHNVVATHHTAGVSHEGRRKVAASSAAQLIDLLNGQKPRCLLNPEVWPAYLERWARAAKIA